MTTYQFFTTAWTWNSILLLLSTLAFGSYVLAFWQRGRPVYFAAALVLFLLAFFSPFSALANFYLFTACTACSVLGIIPTFAPISTLPLYRRAAHRLAMLSTIRGGWGLAIV